jgi:hypothetical protein
MDKVETQALGRDEGSGLLDMFSQDAAKRCLKKMGRRVVLHCSASGCKVHKGGYLVSNAKTTVPDFDLVRDGSAPVERVLNVGPGSVVLEMADIADLTARFRVKGRSVKEHLALGAGE